jgi:tetratricopeptide (TPR) repeat protein
VNTVAVDRLLRALRRNLVLFQGLRVVVAAAFAAALVWALGLPAGTNKTALAFLAGAAILLWLGFVAHSVRLVREFQISSALMAMGRFDDAEDRANRLLGRFSFSARGQFMLFQQLAGLLFRRDRYEEVIAICSELLRHRLGLARGLAFNARMMLADSLLLLDRVDEAYQAIRPVYDTPLSLADRMKLLPIQLRYELAAGHVASATQGLAEKVRVAELLDSQRAALVHALLAEACRRKAMPVQQAFLAERARLYHDLEPLAKRYRSIEPIAGLWSSSEPV